jgi:hypothetical protein
MFGSTFTFAILNIFSPQQQQQLTIPQERILTNKLTKQQVQLLLQNGYTLVEYSYPENCFECVEIKTVLEEATNNVDGQLYLQEIISNNVSAAPTLVILNAYTETAKTIEYPTVKNVTTEVCDALSNPTVWCLAGI